MDKLKLVYKPTLDGHHERGGPVSLTVPHGDVWSDLIDDFIAFLNLTGYHVPTNWVEEYQAMKLSQEEASNFLSQMESYGREGTSTGEDEVGTTYDYGGDSTPPKRGRTRTKKKKKKA